MIAGERISIQCYCALVGAAVMIDGARPSAAEEWESQQRASPGWGLGAAKGGAFLERGPPPLKSETAESRAGIHPPRGRETHTRAHRDTALCLCTLVRC